MTESRRLMYEELIYSGCTPIEAWEKMEFMDFAEDCDYEENYEESYEEEI